MYLQNYKKNLECTNVYTYEHLQKQHLCRKIHKDNIYHKDTKKKAYMQKYQYEYMDILVYLTIKIRMIAYNSVSLLIEKTIKI